MKLDIKRLPENKWLGLWIVFGLFGLYALMFIWLSRGGTYENRIGGVFVPDSETVDYWQKGDIQVTGHFNRDITENDRLFLFLDNLRVSIYRNDQLVYDNQNCEPYATDIVGGMEFNTSDSVTIKASTGRALYYNGALKLFLEKLSLGRRTEIAMAMIRDRLWKIVIIIILYLMGNNLLMYPLEYDEVYNRRLPELYSCGFTILAGTTAALLSADFVSVLTSNIYALKAGNVLFRSLMLVSLLIYLGNMMSGTTYSLLIFVITLLIELLVFALTGVNMPSILLTGLILFAIRHYGLILREGILQRRQAKRAKELEMEVMQSRMDVMRSQIQPHFLFNAMGTIKALFLKNPQEARNAMDYFAKFLRGNMESLGKREKVAFEREMEIVDSYLYIEKIRFGDKLNIEKDIQVRDFLLPCMTVQMLVENAVKHGLQKKEEGGTLIIASKEDNGVIEVTIQDDGVGFDGSIPVDGRVHVGISHTRQLIEQLSNGQLIIETRVGDGTRATLRIPREEEQ